MGIYIERAHLSKVDKAKNLDTSPLPIPAIQIRPHHFTDTYKSRFERALIDERVEVLDARKLIADIQGHDSFEGNYAHDVLGDDPENTPMPEAIKTIEDNLRALKDDDWIEFSAEPDEICRSCGIGNHCKAVNAKGGVGDQSEAVLIGRMTDKIIYLDRIMRTQRKEKTQLFITGTKKITFNDYGGEKLNSGNFTPIEVEIPYLLVNVRFLRGVILKSRYPNYKYEEVSV